MRSLFTSSAPIGWLNKRILEENPAGKALATQYLVKILSANVYDAAIETPLSLAPNLSQLLHNQVFLKREDMQPVFSFKIRGAINKIASLSFHERQLGVVTCSAGNHAQGVALSSSQLGIPAVIVMPEATPTIKVNAVKRFGGITTSILLHGKNYDEAAAEASRIAQAKGLTMIHPFDDPFVISGQGTIGMEIVKGLKGRFPDVIFACVGGGGLVSGIAAYMKAIRPAVKIVGVEAVDAPGKSKVNAGRISLFMNSLGMTRSLMAGQVITLPSVGLFADGAAVRTIGRETFKLCSELVDEMITVTNDEICSAIKLGFNDTRCVLEPAGALSIAGMVQYVRRNQLQEKTLVAVASGANMDFDRLRFVSERADSNECLLSVTIPERPGSFLSLYNLLYPRNVTEFSYRHNGSATASVILSFHALPGKTIDQDKVFVQRELQRNGFPTIDLSDNEMAKAHARHLAGGRAINAWQKQTELLYRFEFPEAPGALHTFLHTLYQCNPGWNISLFHYRNHGHDYGRVLVGLLITEDERSSLDLFLKKLDYIYYEETDNPVYMQFLK